jgi:hypothetical protein
VENNRQNVPAITICSIAHRPWATGGELTISWRDIVAIPRAPDLASGPKNLTVLNL